MYRVDEDLAANREFQAALASLYGDESEVLRIQTERYAALASRARTDGHKIVQFFSTPGRTEIGGNHTDHNQGKVLAAAIDLDAAAAVALRTDRRVRLVSGILPPVEVSLEDLSPRPAERGSNAALIRGIGARVKALGHEIGGFDMYISSEELGGSSLDATGVTETLIVSIFNQVFNQGRLSITEQALIGQFAENRYYHAPCGLMDQITCAAGGVVAIDFAKPDEPIIERLDIDFGQFDARMVVVETGGSQRDLTEDYGAIAWEMKVVASALGHEACRYIDEATLIAQIPMLRTIAGDRAILRAMHFLSENARVDEEVKALCDGRFEDFLLLVKESGLSSFRWLQNIVSPNLLREQGLTLALALTERFLNLNGGGACRVHGAGFAGNIQAWVRDSAVEAYRKTLEPVFGPGSVKALRIRNIGSVML